MTRPSRKDSAKFLFILANLNPGLAPALTGVREDGGDER